ncbi:unnamed protein product [Aphanomyces euteiches]
MEQPSCMTLNTGLTGLLRLSIPARKPEKPTVTFQGPTRSPSSLVQRVFRNLPFRECNAYVRLSSPELTPFTTPERL